MPVIVVVLMQNKYHVEPGSWFKLDIGQTMLKYFTLGSAHVLYNQN